VCAVLSDPGHATAFLAALLGYVAELQVALSKTLSSARREICGNQSERIVERETVTDG
jgi:hypothetical protein